MSEDEEEPLSAVDVAYDFIDKAGDDWTRDELLAALARARFPLDHEAELDDILEAVLERFERSFRRRLKCSFDKTASETCAKPLNRWIARSRKSSI